MEGFIVQFKVYANSQQEADAASDALRKFVDDMGAKGIAVTASKLSSAISRWKDNYFVISYFK